MAKEKKIKEIRVMLPPTLYNDFKKKCEGQYRTVSEVIRNFVIDFCQKKGNDKTGG